MDIFESANSIPIRKVLRFLGIPVKGRRLNCPFHEGDVSLDAQIYENSNKIHCHNCKTTERSVGLVMATLNIAALEAAEQLTSAFHLDRGDLFIPKPPKGKTHEELEDMFVTSILGAIDSITCSMNKDIVHSHVLVILRRLNQLKPSYLSDCTRELLITALQGKTVDDIKEVLETNRTSQKVKVTA